MIITIGRECGSGGHDIGEKLAEHYKIPLYDRKILEERAKQQGIYDEMESFFSEQPMNSLLYSIAMTSSNVDAGSHVFRKLRTLIKDESFVLIGRCGNYVYKDDPECVSLFIHSDISDRIAKTMEKQNLGEKKARDLIRYVDEKRAVFHKYYTGEEWGVAKNYSLSLDNGRIDTDKAVKLIIDYINGSLGEDEA